MDYFSYFIKCIIRNISRLLCKPKILMLIIVIVAIFFFLETSSRAEFTQNDSATITIINNNINYLARQLEAINTRLDALNNTVGADLSMIYDSVNTISKKLDDLKITVEMPGIDSYLELINNNINYLARQLEGVNSELDNIHADTTLINAKLETINSNLNYLARQLEDINTKLADMVENNNNLLEEQNKLQQEQNDLQKEQNDLQKEQNDFLKKEPSNDDVGVGDFSSVNSNDITSGGLSSIFTKIYNAVIGWKSKDITITFPFTDKSFVIPANYTENMLKQANADIVITMVHTVYYFLVGRFMIYSITKIINSIKSGNILNGGTDTDITTDML